MEKFLQNLLLNVVALLTLVVVYLVVAATLLHFLSGGWAMVAVLAWTFWLPYSMFTKF